MYLVSVVLVTHNGVEFMERFCLSLAQAAKIPLELIVVDNNSKDATLEVIRPYFPSAKIVALGENTGFSRACNLGAARASSEYLFFLNQDTEVEPGAIVNLLEAAQTRKDVGLLGAKMKFAYSPEVINSFGHSINRIGFAWDYGIGEMDGEKFNLAREAVGVCGGALFIKRALFLSLSGFDEKFYMYGEDVDLGLRVLAAGFKVLAIPKAVVFHHKPLFSGDSRHFEFLDQKNRWRIVLKNFPPGLLGPAIKGGLRFDFISLLRFLAKGKIDSFFYRLMAMLSTFFSLPEIMARRGKNPRALPGQLSRLISEGWGYPEVDVSYLISKYEPFVARAILKESLRGLLPLSPKILLLRGPDQGMVKEIDDICRELYPRARVVLLVGDKRRIEGFKGEILDFPYEGRINFFFKLWRKIFKRFDVIFILRKEALFKKILALLSCPQASFTIDKSGKLDKVTILRVLQELNLIKIFLKSLSQLIKRGSLRLMFWLGEGIFTLVGLRGKKINKILIIQLGQLGDLILETAAVEALRNKFKQARLISLVAPWGAEFVERDPFIDKVVVYKAGWLRPDYRSSRKGSGLLRTLLILWKERIDLTVDFRGEANSLILAYLSGARLRLGYSLRSERAFLPLGRVKFLLNLRMEFPWQKRHAFHQVEHNLRLLRKIGVEGDFKPRVFFNLEESDWTGSFLSHPKRPLIIVHPGASRREKVWPIEKFSKLIERLQHEYGATVVLVGEKKEMALGEVICAPLKEKPLSAIGQTNLGRLTALIAEADIFIGNESGPMHIAASLSIPTIAIMSGVPSLYGPYKTRCRIVQKRLPCWQPWIEHCYCPDNSYRCLKEIEVEDVWQELKSL